MEYIAYKDKVLAFDNSTGKAVIVDPAIIEQEKSVVSGKVAELESVLLDDKKLLAWAKENYIYQTELYQLKIEEKEKSDLLKILMEVK